MKIAFVYDVAYPWHVGGIEYGLYNEAKELAKTNEVHFFSMRWPGMKEDFIYSNIHYHTSKNVTQEELYRHGRRSIREALFFSRGLSKLSEQKFDVVITNFFPILHLPFLEGYCKRNKAKLIIEVAEIWDEKYWKDYIGGALGSLAHWHSKRVLIGADFYLTNSSSTLKNLLAEGVNKNKTLVYCPVIDDKEMGGIKKSAKKKQKTVIFSGRMIKEKRLDKWLKVLDAAHLKDEKIRGIIIGSGPESEEIDNMIRERGMQDVVKVKPFYNDKSDYYEELAGASLLLNMSEREGLSVIAMESVALGTPVLLPDYTPVPQEIKEMCVVEKETDIPAKIVEIVNAKNRQKYISNAKNLQNFSVSRVNSVYKEIFKKIMKGRSPSSD